MSRLRRSLACAFLALGLTLGLSLSAAAQPPSEPFGDVIDVRVVNVEVVVTDREGKRVSGLQPGDFRLRVDGEDTPIAFFTEVREGTSVPAAAPGALPGGPSSVSPGEPIGTSYLVFIDDYFSVQKRRNEVLAAIKKDLARLGPQDRMAIVSFNGARLTRLSGWSGSPAELGQALDRASSAPAKGILRTTELRSFMQSDQFETDVGDLGPQDDFESRRYNTGLSGQQTGYGSALAGQIESAVAAVVSAMRGAGAPPGRKVLLLLSGGWPFSIQGFLIPDGGLLSTSRQLPDGEQLLRPLTSTANLLGYTIYPVDVPGVETEAVNAESWTGDGGGRRALREHEVHGSLEFLAAETGGRPLFNTNRTAALRTAEADTRSYYWLGFTPTWQRNDQHHRIAVEPLRPGLRARSRTGFLDLSSNAEVAMMVESALMLGNLPGAIPMPMRLGKAVKRKRGELEIPVTLALPVNVLTLLHVNGRYTSQLELRAAVADAKGNRSNVPSVPLTLSAGKAPRRGGYVRYDTRLMVPPSARHLVVAVYDPLSGKISTAEADLKN